MLCVSSSLGMGLAATASLGLLLLFRFSFLFLLFFEGVLVFFLFWLFVFGFVVIVVVKVFWFVDVVVVSAIDLVVVLFVVFFNVFEWFFFFLEVCFLILMGIFVFLCVISFVNVFCFFICEFSNKFTSMRVAFFCVLIFAGVLGVIDWFFVVYVIIVFGNGIFNGFIGLIWCCIFVVFVFVNKFRSVFFDISSVRSFFRFILYDVVFGLIWNILFLLFVFIVLFVFVMFKIVVKNVFGFGVSY